MNTTKDEALKWKKRFDRERASRKEAEKLLEEKSAEIYELNTALEKKIEIEVSKNNEKQKMLFQQSKMALMGEMISNIAHQWRQPLHAIKLISQKIYLNKVLGYDIDEELIKSVESDIQKQVDYLNDTIEDFRNFFKPDKSKETFLISDAIRLTLNIINAALKQKQIQVVLELDDKLKVYNLKNEFMQVLINLIKNSIDILEEKNIKEKIIIIKSFEGKELINIEVMDNGGGIPSHIMPKIFEPYFTTKHQSKGTGLGLYMSHEIITKHMNGSFEVVNNELKIENFMYTWANFKITLHK